MSRGVIAAAALAAVLLAVAPSQIANAGYPAPGGLTLDDAHGWTPEATLDTTQVEFTGPDDDQDGFGLFLGDGWVPLLDDPAETIEGPDGKQHADCWINIGDTSVIACPDGYTALS